MRFITQKLMASHRLCRIGEVEVRIAYVLYLFVGVVLWVHFAGVGNERMLLAVIALAILPLFVLLHELGHAFEAKRQGVEVLGILLHPLVSVAALRGRVPGPEAEIKIALAGPLVSFVTMCTLYAFLLLSGYSNPFTTIFADNFWARLGAIAMLENLLLAGFNLLPVFPLDGGRIATAWAVIRWGEIRGAQMMGWIALVGVGGLIVAGLFIVMGVEFHGHRRIGMGIVLLATFLYTTGRQELQAREFAARYVTAPVEGVEVGALSDAPTFDEDI